VSTEMEEPSAPEKPETVMEMPVRRSANYKTFYANNTKFGISPFDFSFIFGEIGESVEGQVFVDQQVKVIMTPLHAKLFLALLAKNVQNFEQQFGKIVVPQPFLSNLEVASEAEVKEF
jgi:hypothetical protein